MSFGIVRVQKMHSSGVRGIQIHDKREKEISHTNPDINFNKSENNYDLCEEKNNNFVKAIKDKIQKLDLKKAVRKDAVVLAQVLVTSDKNFFDGLKKEKQEEFFRDSYEFLKNRYGQNNVISSTVHLDEKTPHMHFNFVPVTIDNRLSAKSVLTRQNLIEQQTDFYEEVGRKYGLERGERSEDKRKHLETAEFKLQERVKEIEKQKIAIEKDKEQINKDIEELNAVQIEKNKLLNVQKELDNISSIKINKALFGGKISILQYDYDNLIEKARYGVIYADKASRFDLVLKENEEFKNKSKKSLNSQIKNAAEKSDIKKENEILINFIKRKGLEEEFIKIKNINKKINLTI